MEELLYDIVADDQLHARFLNTLSLMENTGACKISAIKDSTMINLMLLKHAAEEHRHAYFLKKQVIKLKANCINYHSHEILAPLASKQYLTKLDIAVYRHFKNSAEILPERLGLYTYLMVTYIIELRADELYPLYQEVLEKCVSKVNVKAIIIEEKGHLAEMAKQLAQCDKEWQKHALPLIAAEQAIFSDWVTQLKQNLVRNDSVLHG